MRLTGESAVPAATGYHRRQFAGSYGGDTGDKTEKCGKAAQKNDISVLLELSAEAVEKYLEDKKSGKPGEKEEHRLATVLEEFAAKRAEKNEGKTGELDDPTARLTKRLVASKTRDEVLTVMSEAYKALGEALKAAGSGDEEAIEVVRRLNKLIKRVSRKLKDLDGEANLRRKESRARKQELEQLARQHEMELKRRIAERKKREKKYLDDPDAQDREKNQVQKISFGAMSKAELEELMRQLMPAALSSVPSEYDMDDTGGFGDASVSAGGISGGAAAEGEVSEDG